MPRAFEEFVPATQVPGPKGVRAAARLMSAIEDEPARLPELFQAIGRHTGATDPAEIPQPRLLLGVTGAPGSGKSSLTDALISEYRRRFHELRIGVIAVDPSSPFTGGAVLGDRVRMMRHAEDPNVFVRSVASRGHLGGLALGVKGVMRVMGLIGCDVVILETVGVGQSEVEIAQVADLVMVVLAPGQGDSIQLLKAGLMEVGDLFVVNKADREGADALYGALLAAIDGDFITPGEAMHHCGPAHMPTVQGESTTLTDEQRDGLDTLSMQASDTARVHLVAATENRGVPELVDALERRTARSAEQWKQRRRAAIQREITESILEVARQRMQTTLASNGRVSSHVQRILAGDESVEQIADALLKQAAEHPERAPSQ